MQASGHREVLGLSARLSEAEVHWRAFFEDLAGRGLKGMELVVSDDHAGLKSTSGVSRVPWQRCQFHLSQNARALPVGSKSARSAAAGHLQQPHPRGCRSHAQTIKAFTETNQALAQWMEDNVREGLTVYAFPRSLHKKPDD